MDIVGTDNQGNVYGIERGLVRSTVYRAHGPKVHLSDVDDVGAIDWSSIFSGLNSNPLLIGLGQKIAGQGNYGGTVPINPYYGLTPPPSSSLGINPTYLIFGVGALALVMMMRR